jgi:hypothetical protein
MHKPSMVVAALAATFGASGAFGQDADLARLREEMQQLQKNYEQRMQALEKRLAEAEARAGKAEQTATEAAKTAEARLVPPPAPRGENAFNPAISLILQGTYAQTSQDPNQFAITGFVPSGGEVGPPRRSFGLGESELFVTANVDPYFRGALVAAFTPENDLEVEEAYFSTLALPYGLTLKGGRFLSGIGYQNEIHQHAWDFQDAPLPYKAFLGGRFQQDGVQMRWVAPTPIFLELGAEVGSGRSFPSSDQNKNGASTWAALAHIGGDIGASYAWRAGVSYLRTGATDRPYDDVDSLGNPVFNTFSGNTRMWIADAVLKWAPQGNATYTNVKLQGEYFSVRESGTLAYNDGGAVFGSLSDGYKSEQSGWYAQAVYQFMPRWRVGYRYDTLRSGTPTIGIVANGLGPTAADFPILTPHNPSRNTAMVDWNPSEFSRLRFQYAADKSRLGLTDHQFFVQYIYSLGPHGAHRF